jgi:hypothetical protein
MTVLMCPNSEHCTTQLTVMGYEGGEGEYWDCSNPNCPIEEVMIIGYMNFSQREKIRQERVEHPDSPSLQDDAHYGAMIDMQNHELGGK